MLPNPKWAKQISQWQTQYVTSDFIAVRKNAEAEARQLLETKNGRFDKATLEHFLELLNTEFVPWNGQAYQQGDVTLTRFQLSFIGANPTHIVEDKDAFNDWSARLWNARPYELEKYLNLFWKTRPILVRGAGIGLPTAILYLKEPLEYNVWLLYTAQGLKLITDIETQISRTYTNYRQYNDATKQLRAAYNLQPQAVDFILFLAGKQYNKMAS